jgi:hypothetical protein
MSNKQNGKFLKEDSKKGEPEKLFRKIILFSLNSL